MSQPIRFHRVAYGSVPEKGWRKGHVYFIYKTDGTGEIKVCKDDNNTLETYTPTVTQQSSSLPLSDDYIGYDMALVDGTKTSASGIKYCSNVSAWNTVAGDDFYLSVIGDIRYRDNGAEISIRDTLSGLETLLASI